MDFERRHALFGGEVDEVADFRNEVLGISLRVRAGADHLTGGPILIASLSADYFGPPIYSDYSEPSPCVNYGPPWRPSAWPPVRPDGWRPEG